MKYHHPHDMWQRTHTRLSIIILMSGPSLLIFCIPNVVAACGAIYSPPLPWGYAQGPDDVEQIIDCANPFGRTESELPDGVTVLVDGEAVQMNDNFFINASGTRSYEVVGQQVFFGPQIGWFLHTDRGYEFFDVSPSTPSRSDLEELANEFFTDGTDSEPYIETILSGDYYVEGDNEGRLFAFVDYIEANFVPTLPLLLPGTYTILIVDSPPLPVWHKPIPWYERIRQWFMPTALAAIPTGDYVYIHTFTLVAEVSPPPEPAGASSVLFLPGIQASRLYTDGVLGTEDRIWEPNNNEDVREAAMTEGGLSVNEVYTRDVVDEAFTINIYKDFLGELEDMVDDGEIYEYRDFAYDWRFSVFDIVISGTRYDTGIKSIIETVEEMADASFTGKVTIIGHSNGGLLAKTLLTELNRLGRADLVDKVVFVGTPQLGTPKAIGVLLHGTDQQKLGGLLIDDEVVREVSRNMPGAYSLLPSEKYFEVTGDTVVKSDTTPVTAPVRAYGDINTIDSLSNFVLDSQNTREDSVPINEPRTLNSSIMSDTLSRQAVLDNWQAPEGVEVYEVVGTGLVTIKGFEYRQFPCVSSVCLLDGYASMKPYPLMTTEGDETVVAVSAGAYEGDKVKVTIDLKEESDGVLSPDRDHADITESPTVQEFLKSVIRYQYIDEQLEIPDDYTTTGDVDYTIIGAHSPVDISLVTDDGMVVGRSGDTALSEVSGSQYFELAGSKYIVVPKETSYTVTVKGNGAGVYSLTIDTLNANDTQISVYKYLGASTTEDMVATFVASSTGFGTIKTDTNGDGVIDVEQFLDGTPVPPVETIFTYDQLREAILDLDLVKARERVLLLQVAVVERVQQMRVPPRLKQVLELIALQNLEQTIKEYGRKRYITQDQVDELVFIIRNLD